MSQCSATIGVRPGFRLCSCPVRGQRDEDVAAFMDQQFAVDAPVALPRETPYPFAALATETLAKCCSISCSDQEAQEKSLTDIAAPG